MSFQVNDNILSTVSQRYDRTITSLNQDVEVLRNWMKLQPHLPEFLDEKSLQNFLIFSKCSVEKAKSRIDMYYTLRSKIPEVYDNMNPENLHHQMDIMYYLTLPKLTKEMYRVFVGKVRDKLNFNEMFEPYDLGKHALNIQEVRLKEDVMYGDIGILDFEGISLSAFKKITPIFVLNIFRCYEKIYSMPLKGIYMINSPPYINLLLIILKTVMKPKVFERIYVSEDCKILLDNFPKEMIPKDYGGEEKSMEELHELLKRKFGEHKKRFDELDVLKVNESLRPQPLKDDEVLGFHGNFKKLDLD